MTDTTRLTLPLIAAAQAQKHVTHNEAILRLDGLVQMTALSYTTSAQPGSPSDGDLYLLPAGKTGSDWGGYTNHAVAHYYDGIWHQYHPNEGWISFVQDSGSLLYYDGTSWTAVSDVVSGTFGDGSVSAPGVAFTSDTNTGLYRIGADNPALAAGGSKLVDWQSAGITQPLQPAFLAEKLAAQNNVTGSSTTQVTVTYETETIDRGSNYDGSSTFTAPVTGLYAFTVAASVDITDTPSADNFSLSIVTSNRTWYPFLCNAGALANASNIINAAAGVVTDMDAGDTAYIQCRVRGDTNDYADIRASGYFSGWLLG